MTGLRATRSFVSDFMRRTRPAAISLSAVTISRFFVWRSGLAPWKFCRARFTEVWLAKGNFTIETRGRYHLDRLLAKVSHDGVTLGVELLTSENARDRENKIGLNLSAQPSLLAARLGATLSQDKRLRIWCHHVGHRFKDFAGGFKIALMRAVQSLLVVRFQEHDFA